MSKIYNKLKNKIKTVVAHYFKYFNEKMIFILKFIYIKNVKLDRFKYFYELINN